MRQKQERNLKQLVLFKHDQELALEKPEKKINVTKCSLSLCQWKFCAGQMIWNCNEICLLLPLVLTYKY